MAKKKEQQNTSKSGNSIAYRVLTEPLITEASTAAIELGKYTFKVADTATKGEIKQSIEDLYGVTVAGVNTITIPRKKRVFGRTIGWKSGYKKAVVALKEGDKIELFKGI